MCTSLLLVTEKNQNSFTEKLIGTLQVENNSSVFDALKEYSVTSQDEQALSKNLEAGDQFIVTFSFPTKIEKEFKVNNILYKMKYFIADTVSDGYKSYYHKALDYSIHSNRNIICALYSQVN